MITPVTQREPRRAVSTPFSATAGQHDDTPSVNAPDALLRWLLRFPLLRVEELAFLSGLSRSRAYTRLSILQDHALITRWRTPVLASTGTHLYAPTARGLEALAAAYGPTVWPLARQWQADERGVQRLLLRAPTLVRTQSFVVALLAGASRGLSVFANAAGSSASRPGPAQIEWSWQRDFPLRFTYRSHNGCVRPSAYVRWAVNQPSRRVPHTIDRQWYGVFILVDSEMFDERVQRRQLRALAWCRDTFLDQSPGGCFPPVLILTSDAHRAACWQSLALRLATDQYQTHPLVGAVLCTDKSGANHLWQANWRRLTPATTCHLTDVLTPVENAARLPPLSASPRSNGVNQHPAMHAAERRAHLKPIHRPASAALDRLTQAAQRLEPRHLSLLTLLYEHPLLSADNLAAFLDVARATVDRYLRLLTKYELISDRPNVRDDDTNAHMAENTHSETCGRGERYTLTRLGLDLLAADAGFSIWHANIASTTTSKSTRRLPACVARYEREITAFAQVLAHTAGVYDFFTQLATSVHGDDMHAAHHRLVWWETGRACERHYREVDGWHAARPDGAGEYQIGQRWLRFWLEWDRGTMNRRDLETKFAAYAHYVQSREWQMDGNAPLPMLLIVTNNSAQEVRILAALDSTLGELPGLSIVLTSSERLLAHGPFAAIWQSYERRQGRMRWSTVHKLL